MPKTATIAWAAVILAFSVGVGAVAEADQRRVVRHDAAYRKKVRRAFSVDRNKAPKAIGVIDAMDFVRQHQPADYKKAVGMLGQLAVAGFQAEGHNPATAQQKANVLVHEARQGRIESLIDKALRMKPEQLKAYMKMLYDPSLPMRKLLPQSETHYQLGSSVNLDNFGSIASTMPLPTLKVHEQVGALVRASIPSHTLKTRAGRKKVQQNIALAEVVHRLAENQHVHDQADKFVATIGGKSFTRLRNFLTALRKSHHKIRVHTDHRSADFLDLRLVLSENGLETGDYLNVAAGLQTTISVNAPGDNLESRVVGHSELVIDISGPIVQGTVVGYQGVGGANGNVGFFGSGTAEANGWSGHRSTSRIQDSKKAVDAVADMGLYTAAVNAIARRTGAPMAGYGGEPGVCNDSTAIAAIMAGQKVWGHPMMGAKGSTKLEGLIKTMMNDRSQSNQADRRAYRKMLKGLDSVSHDSSLDQPRQGKGPYFQAPLTRAAGSLREDPVVGADQDLLKAYLAH